MDKRLTRFIGLALTESAKSTYSRIKIGSVIYRGRSVVSMGANLSTSHPFQKVWNDKVNRLAPQHCLHSEMHALVRAVNGGKEVDGASITIARLNRVGQLADCRPCPACYAALQAHGIQEMIYTTPEGVKHEYL